MLDDACRSMVATGSVIARIPAQKRLLYYCMLLCDGLLLVLNILTTKHKGDWLFSLLVMFNASVCHVNRGHLVTPRQVATDFSYALTSASN